MSKNISKCLKKYRMELAEQKLIVSKEVKKGYYLTGLIKAMRLEKHEWEKIKEQRIIENLSNEEINEIDEYFK